MTDAELRIEADRIYLRELVPGDASERYVSWLRDEETTRFLESGSSETTLEEIQAYIARHQERQDSLFLGIFMRGSSLHVGNIKLEPISKSHSRAGLGILIGEEQARGNGIGTEAIRAVLGHAFGTIGLHRISLGVVRDHEMAIRCYEKVGFRREGVHRDAIKRGEEFVDSITMGILRKDFEG